MIFKDGEEALKGLLRDEGFCVVSPLGLSDDI